MGRPNFAAMTTNERLAEAGLLEQFDSAVRLGEREQVICCLMQVDFTREAAEGIADATLAHPTRYGRLEQ